RTAATTTRAAATTTRAAATTARTAAATTRTAAATTRAAAPAAVAATAAGRRGWGRGLELGQVLTAVALGHDLALVDPALDADAAERRSRLVEAVVDVGAQRVERDAAVGVTLGARHLGAAQPARDLDLHALGTRAHGRGQRA